MTKIKSIEVKNFKAITEESIDFNGCSAIITAGNNQGKTTILRGLIDRMRGIKPSLIVKEGEEKGHSIMELTDGARLEWKFTHKTETFTYITNEGLKITQGVLGQIGEKYFGSKFNIDQFILSPESEKTKIVGKLIGLDFEEIDNRYREAYAKRTEVNRDLKNAKAKNIINPLEIAKPNIDKVKAELKEERIRVEDEELKAKKKYALENSKYNNKYSEKFQEIELFNSLQEGIKDVIHSNISAFNEVLSIISESEFKGSFNALEACKVISEIEDPSDKKSINDIDLKKPRMSAVKDTSKIDELEEQIENLQKQEIKYNNYLSAKKIFDQDAEALTKASTAAYQADKAVKEIEQEKADMIIKSDMPKEFTFGESGLLYNNLPLTNEQQSSSAKYIAALKLAMLGLGEVRALHFDASFLDKNSLLEIQKWAENNNLQLLIERPDFEGGEIQYNIYENK